MIDQKILSFVDVPNMGNYHLSKNGGSGINAIENLTNEGLIMDVLESKTPLIVVHARLMEA